MRWAAVLQKELLEVPWPEVVLEWPECMETYFRHANGEETLLYKGLRVRIGMASGKPQYRKPLNTGGSPPPFLGAHGQGGMKMFHSSSGEVRSGFIADLG